MTNITKESGFHALRKRVNSPGPRRWYLTPKIILRRTHCTNGREFLYVTLHRHDGRPKTILQGLPGGNILEGMAIGYTRWIYG